MPRPALNLARPVEAGSDHRLRAPRAAEVHDRSPSTEAAQTAVVVKALSRRDLHREDPLAEVTELAKTAGLQVLESFSQRVERPHPATYLGRGKLEEAARRAKELDADVILTDNDLSPAQERNLEKLANRTVIDRSQLIMDIFAQRARTHQAKLQVELAQLRYTQPRLKRLWTHLSRYEGGIGMRGPGETQLETDKRLVKKRIQRLTRELQDIERHKESSVRNRRNEFVIALVGYTNAGKSTLLNRLTQSEELVEDKLFATLDTRVRRWELGGHRHVLLTDTVGFIRDLPHHLVASFHATLAETREADLLVHVVDASSSDAPWQIHTVRQVLHEIGCADRPTWLVLNKWDAVSEEKVIDARNLRFESTRHAPFGRDGARRASLPESPPPCYTVSARAGDGVEELRHGVEERLREREREVELLVPHDRGDVLAFVREHAEVERIDWRVNGADVRFRMSPPRLARLERLYPEGFPLRDDDPAAGTR